MDILSLLTVISNNFKNFRKVTSWVSSILFLTCSIVLIFSKSVVPAILIPYMKIVWLITGVVVVMNSVTFIVETGATKLKQSKDSKKMKGNATFVSHLPVDEFEIMISLKNNGYKMKITNIKLKELEHYGKINSFDSLIKKGIIEFRDINEGQFSMTSYFGSHKFVWVKSEWKAALEYYMEYSQEIERLNMLKSVSKKV